MEGCWQDRRGMKAKDTRRGGAGHRGQLTDWALRPRTSGAIRTGERRRADRRQLGAKSASWASAKIGELGCFPQGADRGGYPHEEMSRRVAGGWHWWLVHQCSGPVEDTGGQATSCTRSEGTLPNRELQRPPAAAAFFGQSGL